ncbi:MAG: replication-relaxation family protein [Acidobacteria bacterium]|nr:replication-relaxation family protein [Acidobacteriota bacterium]
MDIFEHRFLTTHQIFQLHFPSYVRARARTFELFQLGVLDRFRPPQRPGSMPWHYVLGRLGVRMVNSSQDADVDKVYFRRNRPSRLAQSTRLRHMRQINDFFCSLVYGCRQSPELRLIKWRGETRSMRFCHGVVRPDGMGELGELSKITEFFFELDRGTEDARRLENKLVDYEEAVLSKHLPRILLFCFLTERRQHAARMGLRSNRLTVATSTLERHLANPLGPNWLIGGQERLVPIMHISEPKNPLDTGETTPPGWKT